MYIVWLRSEDLADPCSSLVLDAKILQLKFAETRRCSQNC